MEYNIHTVQASNLHQSWVLGGTAGYTFVFYLWYCMVYAHTVNECCAHTFSTHADDAPRLWACPHGSRAWNNVHIDDPAFIPLYIPLRRPTFQRPILPVLKIQHFYSRSLNVPSLIEPMAILSCGLCKLFWYSSSSSKAILIDGGRSKYLKALVVLKLVYVQKRMWWFCLFKFQAERVQSKIAIIALIDIKLQPIWLKGRILTKPYSCGARSDVSRWES